MTSHHVLPPLSVCQYLQHHCSVFLLQSLSLYALVGDQLMVVARSIGSNQYQVMDLVLFIQQIWYIIHYCQYMMMSLKNLMSNYARYCSYSWVGQSLMKRPRLVDVLLTFMMRRELQLSGRSVRLCYVIDLSIIIMVYSLGFSVWWEDICDSFLLSGLWSQGWFVEVVLLTLHMQWKTHLVDISQQLTFTIYITDTSKNCPSIYLSNPWIADTSLLCIMYNDPFLHSITPTGNLSLAS